MARNLATGRRKPTVRDDEGIVSDDPLTARDAMGDLWTIYDDALPAVYGYLLRRTGDVATAEDLTSETFLGAIESVARGSVDRVTVPWVLGVARHKLVDHWRRTEREDAKTARLEAVESVADRDPWDVRLDVLRAHQVLAGLGAHHRSALALRHLDGLPVHEVAATLGRTVRATEALLSRARVAFRRAYTAAGPDQEETT